MEKHSQRKCFAQALVALGGVNENVVALEADLGGSTMSRLFGEAYPERYFDLGIAEANMAGWAAGLALTGKIPFLHTFAVFATGRMYDQLRTSVCYPDLPVRVVGASGGLSDFSDGASHQSVEDLALMRALPRMSVFCPADGYEAAAMVPVLAQWPHPAYIRLNRNDTPIVTREGAPFVPGQVTLLRPGRDVLICACGTMVFRALEAASALALQGIDAGVCNVSSLDPIDLPSLAAMAKGCRGVIAAAELVSAGGLGEAIWPVLSPVTGTLRQVCVPADTFGCSSRDYDSLLEAYGLTSEAIAAAAQSIMEETRHDL